MLVELTLLKEFKPESNPGMAKINQRKAKKCESKMPIDEWRRRLALVPEDPARKTLEALTCLASTIEDDNRDTMKRHCKSRFLFLN